MAEQSDPKKALKPGAQPIVPAGAASGGTTINIEGGVHAKRDVIMGNQTVYYQQIAQIQTPAEFLVELQRIQAEIAALRQMPELAGEQAQMIEIVEGQVSQAAEEAQKPQPLAERIAARLNSARLILDSIGGALQSAVDLGVKIGGLVMIVSRIFGA
jgi:hypothetical protein